MKPYQATQKPYKSVNDLRKLLDSHYHAYNHPNAISESNPDPLLALYPYKEHIHIAEIALLCALFSYGNVRAIVRFLRALDMSLLADMTRILRSEFPYYRFQTSNDVKLCFASLASIIHAGGLEGLLTYNMPPMQAVTTMQKTLYHHASYVLERYYASFPSAYRDNVQKGRAISRGFSFLVGGVESSAPLKRWHMFLRWMVRKDYIDLGLWQHKLSPSMLLLPLDTHTFRVSRALHLLSRKSYDNKAVLEVSSRLTELCAYDPIRYDFALYRLGQQGIFTDI